VFKTSRISQPAPAIKQKKVSERQPHAKPAIPNGIQHKPAAIDNRENCRTIANCERSQTPSFGTPGSKSSLLHVDNSYWPGRIRKDIFGN